MGSWLTRGIAHNSQHTLHHPHPTVITVTAATEPASRTASTNMDPTGNTALPVQPVVISGVVIRGTKATRGGADIEVHDEEGNIKR